VIRSVRGRLAAVEADTVVVEVGGVGLLVRCSATTARALPATGQDVSLTTYLVVREDALDLYGFATSGERELFEAFISVGGVGPRMGLAICGVDEPDALRLAVARGDVAKIQLASGVGKRTAERVVLELRGKVGELVSTDGGARALTDADTFIAARDGLVGLGFKQEEAEAALSDAATGASAEELLRHGLARLRR
jgi:Holliday junction DNA helicase RuvA